MGEIPEIFCPVTDRSNFRQSRYGIGIFGR